MRSILRGRCGTHSHLPSLCVAGVAQMALGAVLMVLGDALGLIWLPVPRRHFAWQARHKLISSLICVLGVAQPHIFNFSWQAAKKLRSTIIFCGRRGTHGTGSLSLIWSPLAPGQFAWQTWHKPTSTGFLRGRRRTNSHLLFFCVAGVALMARRVSLADFGRARSRTGVFRTVFYSVF